MKILILKSFGIGNLVEFTPILKALTFNGHECYLIADSGPLGCPAKKILEGSPYVKDIFEFDHSENNDAGDIMRWIRNIKPDLCVQSFPHDSLFGWLIPLLEMPIRKSLQGNGFWEQHEVEYNFDLVKDLVGEKYSLLYDLPSFKHLRPMIRGVRTIVICPSYKREGLWWKKNWGVENYASLIQQLDADKYNIILIDGKDGIAECQLINLLADNKAHNLAGKLSIQESMAVIEQADLVISNDSGPAHIAAAYDRPLMVFFGPTSTKKNAPMGKNTMVITTDLPCMPCQGTEAWTRCLEPLCLSSISSDRMATLVDDFFKGAIKDAK